MTREWAYKKKSAAAASTSFTTEVDQDNQDQSDLDYEFDQNDQIDLLDQNFRERKNAPAYKRIL